MLKKVSQSPFHSQFTVSACMQTCKGLFPIYSRSSRTISNGTILFLMLFPPLRIPTPVDLMETSFRTNRSDVTDNLVQFEIQ